MEMLGIMTLPFLECLVLVGIHSYLGLHVIRRRVIFVDLALAQIAALGTTIAFLFGIDPHSKGAYLYSLAFTFIGAAVFSLTRVRNDKVPQEAVIGLTYALAAAVGILVIFGAPHGAEHIQEIMTGTILWVRASEVTNAAAVYALVGLFHYIFRRRFLLISQDPERALAEGVNVRLWDFLFYMSFGLVITHSVQVAGILLVFVFLVVPAIMAVMLTDRIGIQLAIGWIAGTIVSTVGLAISYFCDLPSGPTVVSLYGLVLVVLALLKYVLSARERVKAIRRVTVGLVLTTALALSMYFVGIFVGGNEYLSTGPHSGHLKSIVGEGHGHAPDVGHGRACGEAQALLEEIEASDIVGKREILRTIKDASLLAEALEVAVQSETKVALVVRVMALDRDKGASAAVELMGDPETPPLFRDELSALIEAAYRQGPKGFDPWTSPRNEVNQAVIDDWREFFGRSP